MFIFYATELTISIYREIKENSRKNTINTQFRFKMLISNSVFWKAAVTLTVLGMSKLTIYSPSSFFSFLNYALLMKSLKKYLLDFL